jgi:hypothetical protein
MARGGAGGGGGAESGLGLRKPSEFQEALCVSVNSAPLRAISAALRVQEDCYELFYRRNHAA